MDAKREGVRKKGTGGEEEKEGKREKREGGRKGKEDGTNEPTNERMKANEPMNESMKGENILQVIGFQLRRKLILDLEI